MQKKKKKHVLACGMACRFEINGQESGWCSQGCQSIVDTGTSSLTAPSQFLGGIMQAIGAQQNQYGMVRQINRQADRQKQ